MKAQNSTSIKQEAKQREQSFFPTNCDFMKDLQLQSEPFKKNVQNGEDYDEIYQTISSGVYENTDGYDLQQQENSQKEQSPSLPPQNQPFFQEKTKEQIQNRHQNERNKVKYEEIDDQQQEKESQRVQIESKNNLQQKQQYSLSVKATQQNRQHKNNIDVYINISKSIRKSINPYPKEQMQTQEQRQKQHQEPMINYQQSIKNDQEIHVSSNQAIYESFPISKEQSPPIYKILQQKNKSQYEVLEQQIKQYNTIIAKKHKNHQQTSHQNTKIHIVGYLQEYFLKIQTQIFQIEVISKAKTYSIKRRFTDCANLQKLIRHHYFGYILYPFPEKTIEFFAKLKLSIGTQQQKIVLIEKRLFELEKYLNFLLSHQEISKSIVLQIFLEQSQQKFNRQMNNLLSISLEQEKQLQLGTIEQNYNNIKKLMKSSLSFFNSYLGTSQTSDQESKLKQFQQLCKRNNSLFSLIDQQLQQCTVKLSSFSTKIERLSVIYKQNSQISNIESNIDSVLKLSSKISSSRSFYEKYADWIENNLIYTIRHYTLLLTKIKQSIERRSQLISKINSLSSEKVALAETILEKIELFDQRFEKDWKNTLQQFDQNIKILYAKFNSEWKNHCKLMTKIWK